MVDRLTLTIAAAVLLLSGALFAAVIGAQHDQGRDYCSSTIERYMDGIPGETGWLSFCVPDHERTPVLSPTLTNQGNAHFRWAAGRAACLFTTDPHGNFPGGGRDLAPRNQGGPYFVAEINAGYQTWALSPGTCAQFGIEYCSFSGALICGDEVSPGQEGVY